MVQLFGGGGIRRVLLFGASTVLQQQSHVSTLWCRISREQQLHGRTIYSNTTEAPATFCKQC